MVKERGQNGFIYPSGFVLMDWLISQRVPSGSAKCAVRNPQRWSVGGLTKRDALRFEFLVCGIDIRDTSGQKPPWPSLDLQFIDLRT